MKKDHRGFNLASKPSGDGCVECLALSNGWWFHLRRCAECGHIGCCDSPVSQHASKHAAATGHPIITSFEPGEEWFETGGSTITWTGRESYSQLELLLHSAQRISNKDCIERSQQ